VGVPHVHLSVIISVPEEAGRYEPNISTSDVYPGSENAVVGNNNVCMYRIALVNRIPLTDNYPRVERQWKISGLNYGQGDMMSALEDTHE